jgi:hypothetical protein
LDIYAQKNQWDECLKEAEKHVNQKLKSNLSRSKYRKHVHFRMNWFCTSTLLNTLQP